MKQSQKEIISFKLVKPKHALMKENDRAQTIVVHHRYDEEPIVGFNQEKMQFI